ncbi:uncharacterized protein [Aquarana catesbeiana]|uniref:uncharacterized protein isoform X1 n=1 Tax=Aquarana catesbeiana TaxID=8400 RepID=UPI003CC9AC7C
MWPFNELTICMLVLCMEFTFSSYFLLGSDVTLKCPCLNEDESQCSVSYSMKNSNAKEFRYEDSLFLLITNFCEKNQGKYICIKNGLYSSTTFELKDRNTKDEFTMYRANKDDVVLLYKVPKTVTHISWHWTSHDAVTKDTIHVNFNNSSTSSGKFHNHMNCSNGVKLPVSLNVSGQYKCILPDNSIGITINLVTVEVNAYSSSAVFRNSNLSITCKVSHVISNSRVLLVWAKVNRYTSVAVKKHNVTSQSRQITVNVTDIDEYSTNWTCLVFSGNQLVALAPLTLKYKTDAEIQQTIITDLTTNIRDEKHHIISTIYIYISVMAVVIIIAGLLWMLRRSGGKAEDMHTLSSKCEEIQYISVSFRMQSTGDEGSLAPCDISAGRPKEHEVLYAQVKQNT